MSDVENILNDVVDTPKEGIEQHEKRKCLECYKQGQGTFIRENMDI